MTEEFEELAADLPDKDKAEYFRVLHEAGISSKDRELAQVVRVLQLYKSYYRTIPDSVMKAASEIDRIKTEIEKLTRQAERSVNAGEASLNRLMNGASEMNELLKGIHSHIEDAANKASAAVSKRMTELLSGAMKKALPLSDLAEAGETFSEAIRESEHACAELRENVKTVRRARFGTLATGFALTFIFAILGTGWFFYSWSERRIDEARGFYIRMISGNNRIVSELAKSKRELILQHEKDGSKLLAIEKATGETRNNHGIIKFK